MKDENLVESVDIDADELFQKINQCGSLKLYRHTDQSEEEGDQMELESCNEQAELALHFLRHGAAPHELGCSRGRWLTLGVLWAISFFVLRIAPLSKNVKQFDLTLFHSVNVERADELNKGVLGEPKIRNQGLLIY